MKEPLFVWITTRKLKPGTYEEFSRSWRPDEIPEGMLQAFEYSTPMRAPVLQLLEKHGYKLDAAERELVQKASAA